MTLIRLIQAASILAGMTVAGLSFHNNPVHADTPTPQFCVIASNGKTACGTLKAVERACVTTDAGSTVCGKFKSAKGEQAQEERQESRQPTQGTIVRKEVSNIVFALKGCRKSDTNVKCEFTITNKGAEGKIEFRGQSTLVDGAGKSHSVSNVDLGGQSNPTLTITPGIDYSASFTFENVPVQAVKAQLLSLLFYNHINSSPNSISVQFKNVSFSN